MASRPPTLDLLCDAVIAFAIGGLLVLGFLGFMAGCLPPPGACYFPKGRAACPTLLDPPAPFDGGL